MRRLLWAVVLLGSTTALWAQNLVLNPSFESTTGCVGFTGGLNNWTDANSGADTCSSPDLFATCFPSFFPTAAPNNWLGNQAPRTGTRYAGIITYAPGFALGCTALGFDQYREYVQGQLSAPLVAGQQYCVSFYVNLAGNVTWGANRMGVHFGTTAFQHNFCNNPGVIPLTPQLEYAGPALMDTTNWVRLEWQYTATGGEQFVTIGNFNNNANTTVANNNCNTLNPYAYYFIEDVSVVAGSCLAVACPTVALTTATSPSCVGGNNGSLDISVTGGTAPLSFVWNTGATTEDLTGLAAGNYTVTVSDAAACAVTATFAVNAPAGITTATTTQNAGCTAAIGAVNLTVSGGTAAYTFQWSNAATTEDITGLTAGTYSVTVTDAAGCTATTSATVNTAAAPTASAVAQTATCGNANGGVNLTVSGGAAPYTFAWTNAATTEDLTNVAPATYTVTVTDANGCTATASATVNNIAGPTATIAITQNPSCGAAIGSLDVTVNGGTLPYSYVWTTGATTQDIANIGAGIYEVTITDANGCVVELISPVSEVGGVTVTLANTTDVSCNGGNNGALDITIDTISTNCGSANVVLNEFVYRPTLSNGVNPNTGELIELIGPPGANIGCYVLSDGDWTITIPPGTIIPADGLYTIGNSAVYGAGFTNLDAENCACFTEAAGGNGLLILTDGGEYISLFNNTGTFIDGILYGAPTAGNTPPSGALAVSGVINTIATPGCPASVTIPATGYLTHPGGVAAGTSLIRNPDGTGAWGTQAGGSINNCNVDIPVTYTIGWSNGATTADITGLTAGYYSVTVTDNSGCTAIQLYGVEEPTAIQSSTADVDILCNGSANGSIDLTVSGGVPNYTYNWSNLLTSQDINNLSPGVYTVTITDNNNCTATASATITEPTLINAAIAFNDLLCNGDNNGAVDLTVTGGVPGYTYNWSNGATTEDLSGLATGNYLLTVTDANGCTAVTGALIDEPTALVLSATSTPTSCNAGSDGTANLTVSGGTPNYSYAWSHGVVVEDLIGLDPGSYTVTVTDANGCNDTLSIAVAEPTAISTSFTITSADCATPNGAADMTVSGGTPGYSYLWSNGTTNQDLTAVNSGSYTVTIADANGCTVSATADVTNVSGLVGTATATDVDCNGAATGAATATVGGGAAPFTFLWSDGATTANNTGLTAGNYTVTITDANGCILSLSTTINEPSALNVVVDAIVDESCTGALDGSINLTVTGGTTTYTFAWSNGSSNEDLLNVAGGDYTLTLTDANGCQIIQTETIVAPDSFLVALSVTNGEIGCDGLPDALIASAVTGGTGTLSYAWNTGSTAQGIANVGAGNYALTVTDANGCTTTASADVTALEIAAVEAFITTNGQSEEAILPGLSAPIGIVSPSPTLQYEWTVTPTGVTIADSVATSTTVTGSTPGDYTIVVTATSVDGCVATDTLLLIIYNDFLGMPSAFTPNNDGQNDRFRPVNLDPQYIQEFKVFNRFGQLVYGDATLADGGWDGNLSGQPQARDNYMFVLTYQLPTSTEPVTLRGSVMLLR